MLPWNARQRPDADRIQTALAAADPEALGGAVAHEASARLGAFMAGIRAYHAHPYRRVQTSHAVLWQEGATRLLDYGGDGRPVLFCPSLINRSYILDLRPGASLMAHLRVQGLRPLLIDWGDPGQAERDFDLEAYITRRLGGALDAAHNLGRGPVPLVGYCMGGLLALAGALLFPDRVSGLALLATPWDFHAEKQSQAAFLAIGASAATAMRLGSPPVPIDLLQAMFAALQPNMVQAKFRRFAAMDPDAPATRDFVALEDWLNDGVALAAPAARDCFEGWYGQNLPGKGQWAIAGQAMRPQDLTVPAFVAVPTRDRIVPPASAKALADALPDATIVEPRAGHIGMVVGSRAQEALWEPLTDWLAGA